MITATCETDLDADSVQYYEAVVSCKVTDQTGKQIVNDNNLDTSESGQAIVMETFSGTQGYTYTATGSHSALIFYGQDTPQPPSGGASFYDDQFNFESFADSVPTYPNYFNFEGPGPRTETRKSTLFFPSTQATFIYPKATIPLVFTGSKSVQDALKFAADNATCSESLGLQNCPSFWMWNIEATVLTSDDASKWTAPQQSVDSGSDKYYVKNGTGNLVYVVSTPALGPDGPDAGALQQVSGSKNIFWIDAPGPPKSTDAGLIIDSIVSTKNFSAKVCSKIVTSVCATATWYSKIIVNPGRQLDRAKSISTTGLTAY